MRFFAILTLFIGFLLSDSFAESIATRTPVGGTPESLLFYQEGNLWKLRFAREDHFGFIDVIYERTFPRKIEAEQAWVTEKTRGGFSEKNIEPPLSGLGRFFSDFFSPAQETPLKSLSETPNVGIWPIQNEWNSDWEKLYSQWLRTEVDPHFFEKAKLATDCADIAYAFRWIFARNHNLPAAAKISGSNLFTNLSMRSQWKDLPTSLDWKEDRRFRAALDYLLEITYTHSLFRDSYPIAIRPDSITEGTHILHLNDETGHTLVVNKVDLSRESNSPITVLNSTVPKAIRELAEHGFWDSDQPKKGEGGLLKFLTPVYKGSWSLKRAQDHSDYSEEQYQPELMVGHLTFAEAVLLKLNPELDFRKRLMDGIQYLKQQISARVEIIEKGFDLCQRENCAPGSENYENFSTPSRDKRLADTFADLDQMVKTLEPTLTGFGLPWRNFLSTHAFSINGYRYSGQAVLFAFLQNSFSSDPRNPLKQRWGMDPKNFALTDQAKLKLLLQSRQNRISDQQKDPLGKSCDSTLECQPKSLGWNLWNSFDIDELLKNWLQNISVFCALTPPEDCEVLKDEQSRLKINVADLSLSLLDWRERIPFLISDPRANIGSRWGKQKEISKTHLFLNASVKIGRGGFAMVHPYLPAGVSSGFNPDDESEPEEQSSTLVNPHAEEPYIFELESQKKIYAPAGFHFESLDKTGLFVLLFENVDTKNPPSTGRVMVKGLLDGETFQTTVNLGKGGYFPVYWTEGNYLDLGSKKDPLVVAFDPDLPGHPWRELTLPAQLKTWTSSGKTPHWFRGESPLDQKEICHLKKGDLYCKGLSQKLQKDLVLTTAETAVGDYKILKIGKCSDDACLSVTDTDRFAVVDIETGQMGILNAHSKLPGEDPSVPPGEETVVVLPHGITEDGKILLYSIRDQNEGFYAGHLDSSLDLIEGKKIAITGYVEDQSAQMTIVQVRTDPSQNNTHLMIYSDGEWKTDELLSDEQKLFRVQSGVAQYLLKNGGRKLRLLGKQESLLEIPPDTNFDTVISEDDQDPATLSLGKLSFYGFNYVDGNANHSLIFRANDAKNPYLSGNVMAEGSVYQVSQGLLFSIGNFHTVWVR